MNVEAGVLCQGTNLEGEPCTRHRTPGMTVCWWHDPDRVEERARKLEEQAARVRGTVGAAQ